MTPGEALSQKLEELKEGMDRANQYAQALNMSMEEMDRCIRDKTPITRAYLNLLTKDIKGDEQKNED